MPGDPRRNPRVRLSELFMSPGSVNERVAFYAGTYRGDGRVSPGGGVASEGEDIEVLEVALADALDMVARGEIVDAKTVLLLPWAEPRLPRGRGGLA